MSGQAPDGWEEVFSGPCVRADLVHAVLESHGLRAVMQQYSPQGWWSGAVMEDCRVYVPLDQVEAARAALAETEDPPEDG